LHVLVIIRAAGDRPVDVIAKEAGINPYVLRKSVAIARSRSIATLRGLIGDLLAIDTASKRSVLNVDDALRLYLMRISMGGSSQWRGTRQNHVFAFNEDINQ